MVGEVKSLFNGNVTQGEDQSIFFQSPLSQDNVSFM